MYVGELSWWISIVIIRSHDSWLGFHKRFSCKRLHSDCHVCAKQNIFFYRLFLYQGSQIVAPKRQTRQAPSLRQWPEEALQQDPLHHRWSGDTVSL